MSLARMSVVIVTADGYERIRKTVSFLARQTVSGALEIVIAAPEKLLDVQDPNWACFSDVKLVETGPFRTTGHPRADAVNHCTTPIVAFAEDHCFPEPNWAERLIHLHSEGWAAVSPALRNANPGALSWADFLLNFGPAVKPVSSGSVTYTPWQNTSYKRELLLTYGEPLGHLLEAEIRLQQDLLKRGYQLFLDGTTLAEHVNFSNWSSFVGGQFSGARLYGSARAEAGAWSRSRRILYASMFPLVPFVRARHLFRDSKRTMTSGRNSTFVFACVVGLLVSAFGEACGYAFGSPPASRRMAYEFDGERHLHSPDLIPVRPA